MLDIAHVYMDDHQKKKAHYWLEKAYSEAPENIWSIGRNGFIPLQFRQSGRSRETI